MWSTYEHLFPFIFYIFYICYLWFSYSWYILHTIHIWIHNSANPAHATCNDCNLHIIEKALLEIIFLCRYYLVAQCRKPQQGACRLPCFSHCSKHWLPTAWPGKTVLGWTWANLSGLQGRGQSQGKLDMLPIQVRALLGNHLWCSWN